MPRKADEATVEEAVEAVEAYDAKIAELDEARNAMLDRADALKKEVHTLKAEMAQAVDSGDLDALADDTAEARVDELEAELRRIREAVAKNKKRVRVTRLRRDEMTGRAVEHFDAQLADDEAELRRLVEEIGPAMREVHRRWNALAAARRRLVACHDNFRAPGKHVLGRKPSDIPARLEVHSEEAPSIAWLDADLPHLAEWRPKADVYRQPIQVPIKARR